MLQGVIIMKKTNKPGSLFERRMADSAFRKRFEKAYPAFELEVQFLKALEEKKWTYAKLAQTLGTSKSNISRDLSGGIRKASLERVSRMAQALGYDLLPLLIRQNQEGQFLEKLHSWGYVR